MGKDSAVRSLKNQNICNITNFDEFSSIQDREQEYDIDEINAQKENISVKDMIEKYSPFKVQTSAKKKPKQESPDRSSSHNFCKYLS